MQRNIWMVFLVLLIYFVISFLTNILGPIIPDLINSFKLNLGLAGFLPFSFFVAYGIMSIPAGLLVEKYGEKITLLLAFLLAFIGAFAFALWTSFPVALTSLFIIGAGMAILQVVINPLLRTSGGEENYAFYSVLAQLFFGAASFLSPLLYSYLVNHVHTGVDNPWMNFFDRYVPAHLKWASLYWVFALTAFSMLIIILLVRMPKVELRDDEKMDTGAGFRQLISSRTVWLYFTGIFAYVGTEQGIANWASKFLQTYHGTDPASTGATVMAYFWGLMTAGCLLGLILLKIFDSRRVLSTFVLAAAMTLLIALFGSERAAIIAFPLCGFFASVMWSIIISLGLNSVPHHHGTLAGILCSGIAGGAVISLFVGALGDLVGLRYAMLFILITLGYIFWLSRWAKPLVNNSTVSQWSDLFKPQTWK